MQVKGLLSLPNLRKDQETETMTAGMDGWDSGTLLISGIPSICQAHDPLPVMSHFVLSLAPAQANQIGIEYEGLHWRLSLEGGTGVRGVPLRWFADLLLSSLARQLTFRERS